MKILFITQKVDKNDAVLGFIHGWLLALSKQFAELQVICLERGEVNLPANVKIFSLGKESGRSRLKYISNFYRTAFGRQADYEAVFVHMNPEYVILGGLFWRFKGKKVVMWYNHTYGDWRAKLAMFLANILCHTSPYAFTAKTKKSVRMPAGIDTGIFQPTGVDKKKNSILYLGRISPIKDLGTLLEAVKILDQNSFPFVLDVYGEALVGDLGYLKQLQQKFESLIRAGKIDFFGSVANFKTPEIFSSHEVSVNLTPAGNYDKTVLETMACGSLPLVSSPAFKDALPTEFFFKEKDPVSLAETLKRVLFFDQDKKNSLAVDLRKYAVANHGLDKLVSAITKLYE
ncbi:MAG: glycosyltransferase family 4 protein [Candidatus Paceibacterota bacterium]|jgi:glycosyltransferase involved in cell wall biosynthesis